MDYTFLISLCVILLCSKFLSIVTVKFQLPQVVGSLLTGLLLGPAILGKITTLITGTQFCLTSTVFLNDLAELGVIVIMFSAGMDTSLDDLKASGRSGLLVALIGVLVPLGMGALLLHFFDPSLSTIQDVFMGTVLTATSVSITVETLKEMGKLSTKVGNTILAAALIDDVLGLICLTIVTSLSGGDVNIVTVLIKICLFFVFVFIVGFLVIKFMDWYDKKTHDANLRRFPIMGFGLCLAMAWAAEAIFGIADIIGAFSAGMIIAITPKGRYISSKFTSLSYLLLSPIFFVNIGLKVDLSNMSVSLILFAVALVAVAILSKLIGCGLGAKICGFTNRQCLQTGLGMACRGEVALIVASTGMDLGVLPAKYVGPIIIVVISCAILTPIMLKMAFKGEDNTSENSQLINNYQMNDAIDAAEADYYDKKRHASQSK